MRLSTVSRNYNWQRRVLYNGAPRKILEVKRTREAVRAEMTEPDALSIHRSFILRLYRDVDLDAGEISGWVEHVVSGEASEFRSVSDLIDCIGRLLRRATHQNAVDMTE
jgi:hypothetical protein